MTVETQMQRRCCANCIYFDPSTIGGGGLCRTRAPSGGPWPKVHAEDWCGEHVLRRADSTDPRAIPAEPHR